MRVCGIIPARMGSSRYPNKPMARILGVPMIGHCYFRSLMCKSLSDVWVATCDPELVDYVEAVNGRAVMTAETHDRASDRVAEAVKKIEAAGAERYDWVALIQGDEPMLMPEMLERLVEPVRTAENLSVVNLIEQIDTEKEFESPDTVKVVCDRAGNIMYFSREPIPSRLKYKGAVPMFKQLGMILFRRDVLDLYAQLEPTPLEIIESVDMNRLLEHGHRIRAVPTVARTHSVDRPSDVAIVEAAMQDDPLVSHYAAKGAI